MSRLLAWIRAHGAAVLQFAPMLAVLVLLPLVFSRGARADAAEAQLVIVRDSLKGTQRHILASDSIAFVMTRQRDAARDSVRIEQQLRDSIYKVSDARRLEARRWRETVEALQLSVVDSAPPDIQIAQLTRQVQVLVAAGDNTATQLTLANQTIEDLRASDLRQRERADEADQRASMAEAQLAQHLAAARAGIAHAIAATRRPLWKRFGTFLKDTGEKVIIGGIGYGLGKLT